MQESFSRDFFGDVIGTGTIHSGTFCSVKSRITWIFIENRNLNRLLIFLSKRHFRRHTNFSLVLNESHKVSL